MEKTNIKKILEENNILKPLRVGEIVEGIVVGKGRAAIFLDLGPYGTGKIYGREFFQAKNKLKNVEMGNKVFSKIVSLDDEEGFIELSASKASRELTFSRLKEKKENGELVNVKVLGANKGGLTMEISGISAFLPVSQLSSENYPKVEGGDKMKILKELQQFVGQELEVKILDLFPRKDQIILSEKAKDMDKIREMLKGYKAGDIVEGEITGITDFGAFIRFPLSENEEESANQLEGLIHISELDWKIIENPSDIVNVGEKIKAQIVDITDGKVSLSLKVLKKDPWEDIGEKYEKGQIITGKATKLNPFGAFVQVSDKIQALCHVSEFENERMEDVLKVDEEYQFEILSIDEKEHKMSLKLKQ